MGVCVSTPTVGGGAVAVSHPRKSDPAASHGGGTATRLHHNATTTTSTLPDAGNTNNNNFRSPNDTGGGGGGGGKNNSNHTMDEEYAVTGEITMPSADDSVHHNQGMPQMYPIGATTDPNFQNLPKGSSSSSFLPPPRAQPAGPDSPLPHEDKPAEQAHTASTSSATYAGQQQSSAKPLRIASHPIGDGSTAAAQSGMAHTASPAIGSNPLHGGGLRPPPHPSPGDDMDEDGCFTDDDDDYGPDEPLRPGKEFVETMLAFEVGETIGDKYEVLEVMSCGTIGRTYRANSTAHDAQCVFKVLCFTSRETLVESVREDQKILTRLQHANVLPVYDVMEDPNHENMIVVTAYVSHRDVAHLAGMLLQPNRVGAANSAAGYDPHAEHLRIMLRDIGVGVRVLHSHHVYHHNLKLENILVTKDGGCCIADAGYSKLFASLTIDQLCAIRDPCILAPELFVRTPQSGGVGGGLPVVTTRDGPMTPPTTSPMANSTGTGSSSGTAPPTPSSYLRGAGDMFAKWDVWCFGMSMYRLAFGKYPYEIEAHMTVEEIHKRVSHHKLREPISDCPADLWEVIKWALEKSPKDRPSIMKLLRHPFFRITTGQSFVEAGNSNSFANGSVANMHRSLTDQHTGFVISVVLGKGPHSENFLVHLPSLPGKVFVLKAFSSSLRKRLESSDHAQQLELRKKLAMSRRIRHKNIAHYYEIVDNQQSTYATQRFFPRGNLAINYPPLDKEGLCASLMLADVLRGLICLHDVGICHLNLKPSNIYYADEECFVISDFGPLAVSPEDIYNHESMQFHVGVPDHVQAAVREKGADGLQFVDTFCVGLIAASVLAEVRLAIWDLYYGYTEGQVDVERIVGKMALRQQLQNQRYPPHFFEFVTTALTQCRTARELLQHPFVAAESKPDDSKLFYFDVHGEDLKAAIRDKFVCRDENRLADLLGHAGFFVESPAHNLGRVVSAASMDRRASVGKDEECMSLSMQNNLNSATAVTPTTAEGVGGAVTGSGGGSDMRISFAFMERLCCGQCRKELKLVIYRCSHCVDYIRCGKCASVDAHGHPLEPLVIENVCHADADDEDMMIAILVHPAAINKHALEELEMQADLPAGTLFQIRAPGGGGGQGRRSFRKLGRSMGGGGGVGGGGATGGGADLPLSRVPSLSVGGLSPAAGKRGDLSVPTDDDGMLFNGGAPRNSLQGISDPLQACDDDGVLSTRGTQGCLTSNTNNKKRLLMEHEAMDDTTPETEIAMCRNNMEKELMLHNFSLLVVPPEMFDPPLAHIVYLNLSNNQLVELPHDISFLVNLQKFSVANNNITALPESIGDLQELQYLDVSHNQLTDLPQNLMFADKLDTIAMDYNHCSEIPGVILDMLQLKVIYLAENRKISKWPPVVQMQSIGPIKFGLDNEPLLWREYHEIKSQLSKVTVMWNKIYPDEIVPFLFCGSLRSAQSLAVYDRLNITFLLTVGRGLEPTVIPGMTHKTVIVDDIEGAVIDHSFQEAVEFIDEAVGKQTGCLVHCFAGMSRSATTVIAYLMMKRGMRLDEAYCTTRRGRPAIYPNAGFFAQLLALDKSLFPDQRPLDMASMERHIIPSA